MQNCGTEANCPEPQPRSDTWCWVDVETGKHHIGTTSGLFPGRDHNRLRAKQVPGVDKTGSDTAVYGFKARKQGEVEERMWAQRDEEKIEGRGTQVSLGGRAALFLPCLSYSPEEDGEWTQIPSIS